VAISEVVVEHAGMASREAMMYAGARRVDGRATV